MAVSFAPSTQYQQWMTKLRVSWMGRKAQAIMGAFAKVAGDLVYDGAMRATLEHLPEYASAQSVGLTASERQITAGPTESTSQLATRTTQAAVLWRYAGTPLGMLLALHYGGFDGAVIVQQNGLGFSLNLPLPPVPVISGQAWQPQQSLVVTQLDATPSPYMPSSPATKRIPAGQPWWAYDFNTDFCSRFWILFPGPVLPTSFVTHARATFTGSSSAVATWNNPFATSSYNIDPSPPTITDTGSVVVWADASTQTTTSVVVRASGAFTGYVDLLGFQLGANPYADLHPTDLQRLRTIISSWKPEKATCAGVSVLVRGAMWGWPVRKWGNGELWQQSTVVTFTP